MGGMEAKKETLEMITRQYPLCYVKAISTSLESFVHFIAKVYEQQSWVGNEANQYAGARDKALNCFASNKQIVFALFEADSLAEIIAFNLTLKNLKNGINQVTALLFTYVRH